MGNHCHSYSDIVIWEHLNRLEIALNVCVRDGQENTILCYIHLPWLLDDQFPFDFMKITTDGLNINVRQHKTRYRRQILRSIYFSLLTFISGPLLELRADKLIFFWKTWYHAIRISIKKRDYLHLEHRTDLETPTSITSRSRNLLFFTVNNVSYIDMLFFSDKLDSIWKKRYSHGFDDYTLWEDSLFPCTLHQKTTLTWLGA